MILVPLLVAVLVIAISAARQRQQGREPGMVPLTPLGRIAVASLALMILVVLAEASLVVTLPVGAAMLALAVLAWWRLRDHGLLLALPLVFGFWTLVVPPLFE